MVDDIELLQQALGHGGKEAFDIVPKALKKIIAERQWVGRLDKDGKPFASFEAFATHRLWQGLETTIDDLRIHCRKKPDVLKLVLGQMEPGRQHGVNQHTGGGDNITSSRGTSALYTLKRLKRHRPDLFQQVLDGTMSANAAAVEAGFRKRPTPLEQVLKLLPKLTHDEMLRVAMHVEAIVWRGEMPNAETVAALEELERGGGKVYRGSSRKVIKAMLKEKP